MGSTFEDTVLDFDINFLHPSSNVVNDCRIDKQRKAIHIAKKKIIATDSLIKKYYTNKEKLDQNEVVLLTAKEECKQVCIDYKDALDKCTQLEKDLENLKKDNLELDAKLTLSQNQYEGIQSHANQLQLLVKDNESVIQALKIEKHLEQNNSDDYEKNLLSIKKENVILLKHLSLVKDIALGKKKLRERHKAILQKYDGLDDASDDSGSDVSNEEADFFDDPPHSPLFISPEESSGGKTDNNVSKSNKMEICIKKDSTRSNEDNDSDCSNEMVSVDTGRGSSLAFSDGEKCFNSPDYFNTDSPIGTETSKVNDKTILINPCKSLGRCHEVVHVATSPLIFDDEVLLSDNNLLFRDNTNSSQEYFITDIPVSDEIVTIKERQLIDIGTSPVKDVEKFNAATSPLLFEEYNVVIEIVRNDLDINDSDITDKNDSDITDKNLVNKNRIYCEKTPGILIDETETGVNGKHTTVENLASHCELEISGKTIEERKCLERNNSKNVCDDNSNDGEIEMILNSMRLTQRLITPIPQSPAKLQTIERSIIQESIPKLSSGQSDSSDVLILKEDNKVLHEKMDNLNKEVMYIKDLLKNHLLSQEKSKDHKSSENENRVNKTQQTFICGNNDSNNIQDAESGITNFDLSYVLRNEEQSQAINTDENDFTENVSVSKLQVQDIFEKDIKTIHVKQNAEIPKNDSREAITFEEDLRNEEEVENDIIIINTVEGHTEKDVNYNKGKITKHKKLSKLNKFKQKFLPKSKISSSIPARKLRSKSEILPVSNKSVLMDPAAILNNKSAYEKAAKVMAEIKCKEKNTFKKQPITINTKEIVCDENDVVKENKYDNNCLSPSSNKEGAHLVVCLTDLKLDTQPAKQSRMWKSNDLKDLSNNHSESIEEVLQDDVSPRTTRSRSHKLSTDCPIPMHSDKKENDNENSQEKRKVLKRGASVSPPVEHKRYLRSSIIPDILVDIDSAKEGVTNNDDKIITGTPNKNRRCKSTSENEKQNDNVKNTSNTPNKIREKFCGDIEKRTPCYRSDSDFNMVSKTGYSKLSDIENGNRNEEAADVELEDGPLTNQINHPKQSILCKMLEKYGRTDKSASKRVPDNVSNTVCRKLEDEIALINELPVGKAKPSMNKLVDEIKSWDTKHFLSGFMKYLKDPDRKRELFNKVNSPPAPPMTKSEQVLLYIIRQMQIKTPDTVNVILTHVEFSLFQLNRTPEFDVIESLSHFYALLCRYFGLKSRLRLFLLDAMYCLHFKVVPLIKQCLDVWMHILPLAHMGIAKSPLVTCLVYLLHFYKCEDRFNRIQEIRQILSRKYFYQITDWNETKILEMFKNAIKEVREIPIERKMLRMALIVLGKRHGPKWCQKNIIKNMVMPMIETDNVPMSIKQFCVEMLGAMLKPFPADMKVHFEITVNQLHDMLDQNPPDAMKEAIFTSLIYISSHNPNRVIQSLLSWMPTNVSPQFEELLRDYVRVKPVSVWKKILSKVLM